MMDGEYLKSRIRSDLSYCVKLIEKDHYLAPYAAARILSTGTITAKLMGLKPYDLHHFNPTYEICGDILNSPANNESVIEEVLKCVVIYKYNELYFNQTFIEPNEKLYKLAAKSNNIEIYEHQKDIGNFEQISVYFDYNIFIAKD